MLAKVVKFTLEKNPGCKEQKKNSRKTLEFNENEYTFKNNSLEILCQKNQTKLLLFFS